MIAPSPIGAVNLARLPPRARPDFATSPTPVGRRRSGVDGPAAKRVIVPSPSVVAVVVTPPSTAGGASRSPTTYRPSSRGPPPSPHFLAPRQTQLFRETHN